MPLPLEQISTVDARRRDLDQHLVRSWAGGIDLSQFEHIRRAGFPCNDRFHAPQRAIACGLGRLGSGCSPQSRARGTALGEVA